MAASVIKEINSVKAVARARRGLDVDGVNPTLMASFVDCIVKQINATVAFSTQDAGQVFDALADSPYGDQTRIVIAAIEARLKSSQSGDTGNAAIGGPTQHLKCWWAYCLQSDWDFIRNKQHSWNAKMTRLVDRGMSLGVNHPDEQCLKWLLALLLIACYDELPDYKIIFAKLYDLKQAFIAERKSYPLAHVAVYPPTPAELSADMFNHAYGDEQPVTVELHGINTIAENHIPLRKNSKLLKPNKKGVDAMPQREWDELKGNVHGSDRQCVRVASEGTRSVVTRGLLAIKDDDKLDADDAEEQALLLEYQAKLVRSRQRKAVAQTSGSIPATQEHASIMNRLTRTHELGPGLRLVPRATIKSEDSTAPSQGVHAKEEPPERDDEKPSVKVKTEIKHEHAACDDDDIEQLDPYARAAIAAMRQRNDKKKEAEKKLARTKNLRSKIATPIQPPRVD